MSNIHLIESRRSSNTTLEQLGLLDHWRNPVIMLIRKGEPVIDGVVEIFLTKESVNGRVAMISDKSEFSYCQVTCIQAVNAVMMHACEGLSINGLAKEELYITKKDLLQIEEPVQVIIRLMAIISEVEEPKQAFLAMQQMPFYLLGELPEEAADLDVDLFASKKGNGSCVKLFVRKEHAKEENARNFTITRRSLADITKAACASGYGIAIEPYEAYGVEFSKDEMNSFMFR